MARLFTAYIVSPPCRLRRSWQRPRTVRVSYLESETWFLFNADLVGEAIARQPPRQGGDGIRAEGGAGVEGH